MKILLQSLIFFHVTFCIQLTLANWDHNKHHVTTPPVPGNILASLSDKSVCRYRDVYVACNGFKSQLRMYLLTTRVQMLSITNNDLPKLERRVMGKLRKLKFLDMRNNSVTSLRRVFNTNTNLKWLIADHNQLGTAHSMELSRVFEYNTKIEFLSMSDNQIRYIPPAMFGLRNSLSTLNLADNDMKRIERFTFHKLRNLAKLDLHNNHITYINANAFKTNGKLERLDLCNNLIAFEGQNSPLDLTLNKELKYLEMSSNKMTSLDELDLSGNPTLTYLDVSFNQIGALDGRALRANFDLYYLNASYNHIQWIDEATFQNQKNLHSLDLSHNQLTTITKRTLQNMRGLQVLSLAYNSFTILREDLFYGNGRLGALDMRGNQLSAWQPNTIYSNIHLKFLDLRDNLFQVESMEFFTANLNAQNEFDVGDFASASHVGEGEDPETIRRHKSLNNKVFARIDCLRLSGNPLASQAYGAATSRMIHFWAGKKQCEVRNHGEKLFRCGCLKEKLNYTLDQWVAHDDLN